MCSSHFRKLTAERFSFSKKAAYEALWACKLENKFKFHVFKDCVILWNLIYILNQIADHFCYIYALIEIIVFYPKQNKKTNDKLEGKILTMPIKDRELISLTWKASRKKMNNPIEKWTKDMYETGS